MQPFTNKTIVVLFAAFFVVFASVIGITKWRNIQTAYEVPNIQNQPINNQLQPQTLPENHAQADITNWKTYRNKEYGFELKYPADLETGITNNSALGSVQHAVPGIDIGPITFVALDTSSLQKARMEYINRYTDIADHPENGIGIEEGPSINCKKEKIPGISQAVSCNGEGGPALYALVEDKIFIQVQSKSLSSDEVYQILSTFKFVESKTEKNQVKSSQNSPLTSTEKILLTTDQGTILRMNYDGSEVEYFFLLPHLARSDQQAVSPDHKKILYVFQNDNEKTYEVRLINIDSFPASEVIVNYPRKDFSYNEGPLGSKDRFELYDFSWSPDSHIAKWILSGDKQSVVQYYDFTNKKLGFIADLLDSGKNLSMIGSGNSAFSPDGKFFSFIQFEKNNHSIGIYNLETKTSEQLKVGLIDNGFFDINNKLYYYDRNGGDLTAYNPYTRKREYFDKIPEWWSGLRGLLNLQKTQRVYICEDSSSIHSLCLADAQGNKQKILLPASSFEENPALRRGIETGVDFHRYSWSPDGNYIYMHRWSDIVIISVKTGEVKVL